MLTPAGTVEHRLPSGDSGFENLVLAGDWTSNGIDGGCVEAAVISGMDAAKALTGSRQPIPGGDTALAALRGPGSARLRGVRRARHRARAVLLRAGAAQRPPAARRQGAHRRARGADVQRPRRPRDGVPRARLAGAALDRELRAGHLADPTVRPLGRRDRDPGVVLDPGGRRPRPRRAVRGRAPAAGRAVHLRGQPDVLPRGPRGVRVCQDDGALLPRRRPRRDDPRRGIRRRLRSRRGGRLAQVPRGRGDSRTAHGKRPRARPPASSAS